MNITLDEKLVKAFPNLYRDRHSSMGYTAMCWGFDCGDGWFKLIWDLSEKLEKLIIEYKKQYPDDEYYPAASQVKEKYGTLRFYMNFETDEMRKLIDQAEKLSAKTCEVCGKRGKARGYSWIQTLCKKCSKE